MSRSRSSLKKDTPAPYGEVLNDEQRNKVRLVFLGLLATFSIIIIRLHFVHLVPDKAVISMEAGHVAEIALQEPRGEIYDRNAIRLATNREVPMLWVNPQLVENPEAFADDVASQLHIDESVLLARLMDRKSDGTAFDFKVVKRFITEPEEIVAMADLLVRYDGVLKVKYESLRYYPQLTAAAQLLGFVNRDNQASEGVELMFDKHLRSEQGVYKARTDTARRMLESRVLEYTPAKAGEALQLTLDVNIQHTLEAALDQRLIDCNASQGMGILMDPHTGAILAMATRPAYDPNYYDSYTDENRKNKAITDVFEPGSAFKIVTAAAAIELGLITPETQINCENGRFNPSGHHSIKDFHPLGVEPFTKCFEESSNIAIIKVASKLGPERLDQWIRAFGFGQRTSRDFPQGAESVGIYRDRKDWNRLSMGSLPMGQEIAVTMPQLAKAFAIIANGGYPVEPYFVERAIAQDGTITYQHEPMIGERILSEETAATMRDLLHRVVLNGTGDDAAIEEYEVGGKTGTAQMKSLTGKGYSADRFTTVFAGIAPVSNPRIVGVIVVKEPMIRLHYGGYVCGPVFRDVVRDALVRLDVPADVDVTKDNPVKLAKAMPRLEMVSQPAPVAAPVPEAGDGDTLIERLTEEEVQQLLIAMENDMESLEPLELTAPGGDVQEGEALLPDLMGLTKRQVHEALGALNVAWDPQGAGRVIAQSPPPGTPVSQVSLCSLEFGATLLEPNNEES